MLRDCHKCGALGLAMCACVVGGEFARSMKEAEREAKVTLFTALKAGSDQPHTHDDPEAPPPRGAVLIRASSTASMGLQQGEWAAIPSSIVPPLDLRFWRAPPWLPEIYGLSDRST